MKNENILIFDTETTGLIKPFCYNIGYVIYNITNNVILEMKSFICEQIWHNIPLFSTAYYADKRQLYIKDMRAKKTLMKKYGYICQEMARDIKKYNIENAFAFNSNFDDKVFTFNCDFFKCVNPFDNVQIKDIRAFVHKYIVNKNYIDFCEKHELFTDSGNYSTTAESVYKYITQNENFTEEHTALEDSIIETEILVNCINKGAKITEELQAKKTIPREIKKDLTITINNKKVAIINCKKYTIYRSKNLIKIEK